MLGRNDKHTAVSARPGSRRVVVIFVYDGVEALDVTGPAGVFDRAEALHPGSYEVVIASMAGGPVTTAGTVSLADTRPLSALKSELDTVLIAGGSPSGVAAAMTSELAAWLRHAATVSRRIGSVCSGAFLLGGAGLLDGRRVTTHWRGAALLQRMFPKALLDADAIYTFDGVYTSAGVTAGIDLGLALVAEDLGDAVSADIARDLVVYLRRSGGQSQYSRTLAAQARASSRLAGVLQWLAEHLDQPIRVPDLAAQAGMSERNFVRLFAKEIGVAPAHFITRARVERAQDLLERTAWPLERVAARSGFGSVDSLQRAFRVALGTTPSLHRARFTSGGPTPSQT